MPSTTGTRVVKFRNKTRDKAIAFSSGKGGGIFLVKIISSITARLQWNGNHHIYMYFVTNMNRFSFR